MNKKMVVFSLGVTLSIVTLSLSRASLPMRNKVTDDTLIYERLSEIRAERAAKPNFDADLQALSQLEGRYQEKLPALERLRSPMKRVAAQKYQYSGKKTVRQ